MNAGPRFARHFLLVALAVGSLYLVGRNGLAPPPLTHPARLPAWWAGKGPVVAVFSAARVALLAAGTYWLVILAAVAVFGTLSPSRLTRAVPGKPLIGARRAVRLALGASALGSVLAGSSPPVFASAPTPTGSAPTLTNLAAPAPAIAPGTPTAPTPAPPVPTAPTTAPPTATTAPDTPLAAGPAPAARPAPASPAPTPGRDLAPSSPTETPAPPISPAQTPGAATETPAAAPTGSTTTTTGTAGAGGAGGSGRSGRSGGSGGSETGSWIVRPGDNLWFIAERTLAAAWGRAPTDRQVGRYWVSVIAANRSQLPDPSDPSLLFPGDLILLPAVLAAPPA
jgi:hypothetical protein